MFNPQASEKLTYDGPPLSILMAVSMLDEQAYDIKIIDWHYGNFQERLVQECREAMVFGVTCMTGFQIGKMIEALRLVKSVNPGIKVVCGGWHPTLLPEQTLKHELIDYIVMGQGPITFRALLECLGNNAEPRDIKGVGYKRNGQLVINEIPPLENINRFPVPPYHLLENVEKFLVETSFAKKVLYLITSQGCPNNCYFCSEAAFHHRKWTSRPVDDLMQFIEDFKRQHNIDGVAVSDSNFFVNEKRVAEFCRRMIPLRLRWGGTSSRSDQLARYSDETWALMRDSGLYDIFLGVESASNETLRIMNKGCAIEDTLAVLPKAQQYGIKIQCAFVIGVPGSDIEQDFKTDMEFINRVRKSGQATQFHMFTFAPFPGIPFLTEAMALGYRQPQSLEEWGNYNLHMDVSPWIPAKYPRITDQLSVYFMFLTGNTNRVVRSVVPRWLHWAAVPAERLCFRLADCRVSKCFFRFPVEYHIAKFALKHRRLLFGDKKLMF